MLEKVAIVEELVENGYCLFDESVAHFAGRFSLEVLEMIKENFLRK